MKKPHWILFFEFICIVVLGILVQTAFIGGFSLKIGLLKIRSHNFVMPTVVFITAFIVRGFLTGNLWAPFHLAHVVHQIEMKLSAFSDDLARRFVVSQQFRKGLGFILLILLLSVGALTFYNPLPRGLTGSYYDNAEWEGEPFMRVQEPFKRLSRMKRSSPFATENYSIEWKGFLMISTSGEHEFTTVSQDGSELYIEGQRIVDNSGQHEYQERRGTIRLEKGLYAVHLKYMKQAAGFAELRVFWSPPGKLTGQRGIPFSKAPLFIKITSYRLFRLGLIWGKLLTLMKILCVVFLVGAVLEGLCSRHILFPSSSTIFVLSVIFLGVFISHFFWSEVTTSFDSRWSIHTTLSIIKEGNTNLDEYQNILREHEYYSIEHINGHLYTKYPLGSSILALPFVYVIDRLCDVGLALDLQTFINKTIPEGIEKFIASIFVAISAMFLFLVSEFFGKNLKRSLLLVFVFAFCTTAWSTGSRALWQHAPSMLMLTISLYLFLRVSSKRATDARILQFVSIPLALSYVIRPTNSIPIIVFTLYMLIKHRKYFLPYCGWSLLVAVPFLLYNLHIYQTILPPYYLTSNHFNDVKTPFFEALAGILFSPSRGLFIFSPVLLFSLYGIVVKLRHTSRNALDFAVLAILCLHTLLLSVFPCWWGGHTYGPRLFSDVLPFFLYFLIPALSRIADLQGIKRQAVVFILMCTVVISFYIHYRGATSWKVYEWNSYPVSVEKKLWDWQDIQFFFGVKLKL